MPLKFEPPNKVRQIPQKGGSKSCRSGGGLIRALLDSCLPMSRSYKKNAHLSNIGQAFCRATEAPPQDDISRPTDISEQGPRILFVIQVEVGQVPANFGRHSCNLVHLDSSFGEFHAISGRTRPRFGPNVARLVRSWQTLTLFQHARGGFNQAWLDSTRSWGDSDRIWLGIG